MAWYRLAAGLLRQDDPAHHKVLYWDDGPLHAGELLLWLDAGGDVARFLLSHRPFRGHREHCVEWRRGGAPRFGEVDDGEAAGRGKMAPLVHYRHADTAELATLQAYLAANVAVLEADHGATIAKILGPAAGLPFDAPGGRRREPRHAISGKGGGMGDGTAATRKGVGR